MHSRWLLLASMLLSGCEYDLVSETPVIPEAELFDPASLAGDYWVIEDMGGSLDISSSRWQTKDNRTAARGLAGADTENQTHFRLVELAGEDVLLDIRDDPETGMSGYGLLVRDESGLIDLRELQIIETAPWVVQDRAYRSQVAAGHGLTIDMDPDNSDGALIDGPIDGTGIIGLLRDPLFLATVSVEFEAAYLPMGTDAELASPDVQINPDDKPLRSISYKGGAAFDLSALANPPDLAGVFDVEEGEGAYGLSPVTEMKRLENGNFRLDEIGFEASLLALPQEPMEEGEPLEAYLALQQWILTGEANTEIDEDTTSYFWLITRDMDDDDCWDFGEIYEALPFHAKPLDEMRVKMMYEAAKRHSLNYGNGGVIKGDISPSNLVALFRDGQFTSAVVMNTAFSLCPREVD